MHIRLILIAFICGCFLPAARAQFSVFTESERNDASEPEFIPVEDYWLLHFDAAVFAQKTENIPFAQDVKPANSPVEIDFPLPDGTVETFRVVRYRMYEPELAAAFPDLQTFIGVCVKNPLRRVRFDLTALGLRALIHHENGRVYYDPPALDRPDVVVCYRAEDLPQSMEERHCELTTPPAEAPPVDYTTKAGDCQMRVYRTAVAVTGEYANYYQATSSADAGLVLSAVTTSFNRANDVLENDLGIRLILKANTDALFYYDPNTDPYTNNDVFAMLSENQTNVDNVIGSANYDIGHVLATSQGGVASLGVVCNNSAKARGVTGLLVPQGDPFDIDCSTHEIGPQLGANHTFNNDCAG